MADQDTLRIGRGIVDAFNAGDWDTFQAVATADVAYIEPATGRRIEGGDAFIAMGQGWRAAFPGIQGTVERELADAETAVLEITWAGTHTGELVGPGGTIPATGRSQRTPAVMLLDVSEGKVREIHHYFDMLGMLQQLGIEPGVDPAGE